MFSADEMWRMARHSEVIRIHSCTSSYMYKIYMRIKAVYALEKFCFVYSEIKVTADVYHQPADL